MGAENMPRRMLLLCAVLSILAQLSGCSKQHSSMPPQAPADTAPVHAEIQKVEASLSKINDRGAALFLLAKQYAQLGELLKALSLLKECISLDEGFDPGDSPALRRLQSVP